MLEPPVYIRLLQSAKTSFAMTVLNKVVEKAFVSRNDVSIIFLPFLRRGLGGG